MIYDPVVEEIRAEARKLEEKLGHDIHAYFEYMREAQKKYPNRIVQSVEHSSLPPTGTNGQ